MRGYLSFVLVFLAIVLVFSMLNLNIKNNDPKMLITERIYSTSMNVKEIILESLDQGAEKAFRDYDAHHNVSLCRHCTDHYCSPEPLAPNFCNAGLCKQCFRVDEARAYARQGAFYNYEKLKSHIFDPEFDIDFSNPEIEVFLQSDPLFKNGYFYHSYRIETDILIYVNGFETSSSFKIPRGFVYDNN
ncbi:hypothetical protein JXA56_02535 [Candidatus Micrarchaeota archaeon]|nr:hypothetical protein [Candidatus Micrarchaeota archaeon]